MAFADIFIAVTGSMASALAGRGSVVGFDGNALPTPSFTMGVAGRRSRDAPPRVSWLLGRERFAPAKMTAAPGTQFVTALFAQQPRALRTRRCAYDVEVWGPTKPFSPVNQAGSLQGQIVVSGRSTALSSYYVAVVAGGTPTAPKVAWSTDGATFSAPITLGASPVALGSTGVSLAVRGTFQQGDNFHFVGHAQDIEDYATTDAYANALMSECHKILRGSYEFDDGDWQVEGEQSQAGKLYHLILVVDVPVTEVSSPAVALAQVTSVPQTDILGATSTTP